MMFRLRANYTVKPYVLYHLLRVICMLQAQEANAWEYSLHSSFSSFPKSELKTRRKYIVEVGNSITTAILEIVGCSSFIYSQNVYRGNSV